MSLTILGLGQIFNFSTKTNSRKCVKNYLVLKMHESKHQCALAQTVVRVFSMRSSLAHPVCCLDFHHSGQGKKPNQPNKKHQTQNCVKNAKNMNTTHPDNKKNSSSPRGQKTARCLHSSHTRAKQQDQSPNSCQAALLNTSRGKSDVF